MSISSADLIEQKNSVRLQLAQDKVYYYVIGAAAPISPGSIWHVSAAHNPNTG